MASNRRNLVVNRRKVLAGALSVAACGAVLMPASEARARGVVGPSVAGDERFMLMAIEEAALGDVPFGSVIVRDGKVIARGHNLTRQQRDPTAHGEMVSIRNALKDHGPEMLIGTTIYCSGEACAMCMGAIVWCGIARVVYGASAAEIAGKVDQIRISNVEIANNSPWADIAITEGVLARESLALFK